MKVSLDWKKVRVGQYGGCALRIRFWPRDGARLTCPMCGVEHEVECDEALDLSSGERTKVVLLVAVKKKVTGN